MQTIIIASKALSHRLNMLDRWRRHPKQNPMAQCLPLPTKCTVHCRKYHKHYYYYHYYSHNWSTAEAW